MSSPSADRTRGGVYRLPRHSLAAVRPWRAEAERLAVENAGLGRENATQRVRIADLEGQVAALTEKVATLTTLVFGGSTAGWNTCP